MNFKFKTNRLFFKINKWFERNLLVINYEKTNLAQLKKGICYMRIKIFNHLPTNIKSRSNDLRSFKLQLTTILLQNSFYTCDEFFTNKFAEKGTKMQQTTLAAVV
jgi:hypothetical protein